MSDHAATAKIYKPHEDPEMIRHWMKQGPKTAAFLLVIPGATLIGVGVGMLLANPRPWGAIGLGAGSLIWGLVVALGK